ncbi:MAG: hypothetical protein K1W26_15445 [Acetatifactor sp.]
MSFYKKSGPEFHVNVGSSSILLIFVILCLISFATLSIVSANADAKLSSRVAERTAAYYEACNQAQENIASIDRTLASVYADSFDEDEYFMAVGHKKTCIVAISDLQTLTVTLDILYPRQEGDPFYRVTSWQVVTDSSDVEDEDSVLLIH